MNNFVTVYELLGLIKDGKIKEETYIKYYDKIWGNDETLYVCLKNIINKLDEGAIELNDKVEILEEDKPTIEKIKNINNVSNSSDLIALRQMQWENNNIFETKLNEIIEFLNDKFND